MRLFLDSSVLLAACGSSRGASREVIRCAPRASWLLLATPYVVEEVLANLPSLPVEATVEWGRIRAELVLMDDVLTLDGLPWFNPPRTGRSSSARWPGPKHS